MLSRRWIINYLLFILIIIFTWIGTKYPVQQGQDKDADGITQLKAQDISEIKIETADETILLQKQGSRWEITQPVQWFANNVAAERLTTLATLQPESRLPKDQIDLSELGLRIPKAVVTLNQTSIYFGDVNRIGNRRYLMVDPDVFLANDIHHPFINQGINGLLDKRLLPAQQTLQSLQLPGFKLDKQETGWHSDQAEASKPALAEIINHWQRSEASSIKAYDKSLTPLNKVIATLESGVDIEFYLLSIKPEIILARPDLGRQYHFPDHLYYKLLSLENPSE